MWHHLFPPAHSTNFKEIGYGVKRAWKSRMIIVSIGQLGSRFFSVTNANRPLGLVETNLSRCQFSCPSPIVSSTIGHIALIAMNTSSINSCYGLKIAEKVSL